MGQKTFTVIAASSGLCRVELESGRICGLENGDVLPFRPPWLLLHPKFLRWPRLFSVRKFLAWRPHRENMTFMLSKTLLMLGSPHQTLPAASPPGLATNTRHYLRAEPKFQLRANGLLSQIHTTLHSPVTWGKCSGMCNPQRHDLAHLVANKSCSNTISEWPWALLQARSYWFEAEKKIPVSRTY